MTFKVKYSNRAIKFLRKIGANDAKRVFEKIERLTREPLPRETKKIVGSDSLFRVRVGDYRILYEVDSNYRIIGIVNIDNRDKAYKK